jgi:phosphate/sulfate permease
MARWMMILIGAGLVAFLLITGYRIMKTVESRGESNSDNGDDNGEHI